MRSEEFEELVDNGAWAGVKLVGARDLRAGNGFDAFVIDGELLISDAKMREAFARPWIGHFAEIGTMEWRGT